MTVLNRLLGRVADALLQPFAGLPPLAGLAVVSIVVAVAMLLVFRSTSDQAGIASAKRRMQAGLFEIRLFNHDLRAILRAQADILRHNLTYLRLSLVPLAVLFVPLTLLLTQLQSAYGHRPFLPGESFLLKLRLQEGRGSVRPETELVLPEGLTAETPDVWLPALSELAWRVRAERAGRYTVRVRLGGETLEKDVRVTGAIERISPVRQQAGFLSQLLYPAESPLPRSSEAQSLAVTYAARDIPVLGRPLHWMFVFFVLVISFALLLKNRFRVSF